MKKEIVFGLIFSVIFMYGCGKIEKENSQDDIQIATEETVYADNEQGNKQLENDYYTDEEGNMVVICDGNVYLKTSFTYDGDYLFYGNVEDFFMCDSVNQFVLESGKCHTFKLPESFYDKKGSEFLLSDFLFTDGKLIISFCFPQNERDLEEALGKENSDHIQNALMEEYCQNEVYFVKSPDNIEKMFEFYSNVYSSNYLFAVNGGVAFEECIPQASDSKYYSKIYNMNTKEIKTIVESKCTYETSNNKFLFWVDKSKVLWAYDLVSGENIKLLDGWNVVSRHAYASEAEIYILDPRRISRFDWENGVLEVLLSDGDIPSGYEICSGELHDNKLKLEIDFPAQQDFEKIWCEIEIGEQNFVDEINEKLNHSNGPKYSAIVEDIRGLWYYEKYNQVYYFENNNFRDTVVEGVAHGSDLENYRSEDIQYELKENQSLLCMGDISDTNINVENNNLVIGEEVLTRLNVCKQIPYVGVWESDENTMEITSNGWLIMSKDGLISKAYEMYYLNEQQYIIVSPEYAVSCISFSDENTLKWGKNMIYTKKQ